MLKTTKSTNLNGDVMIDGEIAMTLQASVKAEKVGYSSIQQTVLNQPLYNANKVQCRKDVSEFQEMVYKIEDDLITEMEVELTKGK